MSNKTITVISQNSGLIHHIQNLVSVPVSLITSLSDLWTSLSTNPANIQLVVLDLKHFANSNLQVFDLSTLLNIMSRANNCAPILAAWVTPDMDPLLIKQLEDADATEQDPMLNVGDTERTRLGLLPSWLIRSNRT